MNTTPNTPPPAEVLICLAGASEVELVELLNQNPRLSIARRCLDLVELVSVALAGVGRFAVISAANGDNCDSVCMTLIENGVTPVLWGVSTQPPVVGAQIVTDPRPAAVIDQLLTLTTQAPALPVRASAREQGDAHQRGPVVAILGPHGGPGRTTLALGLAAALTQPAAKGSKLRPYPGPVLVIDCDVYAPAVLESLALQPGSSGLLKALHQPQSFTQFLDTSPGFAVLSGLPGAFRWREVDPNRLATVIDTAAAAGYFVILDTAAFNPATTTATFGPNRDAVTTACAEAADVTVFVGRADPVGVTRTIQLLDNPQLASLDPVVVINQTSREVSGPKHQIREVLAAAGWPRVIIAPSDPLLARAHLAGTPAPARCPFSQAMAELRTHIEGRFSDLARA